MSTKAADMALKASVARDLRDDAISIGEKQQAFMRCILVETFVRLAGLWLEAQLVRLYRCPVR